MSDQKNEAASADIIARQVAEWTKERDRLQDLINAASAPEDGMQFYGKPITAEDVASFDELAQEVAAEAASASQSNTAGAAKDFE